MKNSKKQLPFKEDISIKKHGKKRYRVRKQEEKESKTLMKEYKINGNQKI